MNKNGRIENLTHMGIGKAKGTKNKFTKIKEEFVEWFKYKKWAEYAEENPDEAYKIISSLLPKTTELDVPKDSNYKDILLEAARIRQQLIIDAQKENK